MIDTLLSNRHKFRPPEIWELKGLKSAGYILVTLHRPSNFDDPEHFKEFLSEIIVNANDFPIVFPMHPRTRKTFENLNIKYENLVVIRPLGYHEFNFLVENSQTVITDSDGITEETTVLDVPCITIRDTTERPKTVETGTNELIGRNLSNIMPALEKLFSGNWKEGDVPELWDGKAAERIVQYLLQYD